MAQAAADADSIKLAQEVDALRALHDLELSPDQLSGLKGMISDTAGTLSDTPTAITAEYVAALKDLRGALLSKDQNKIETAEDKADDLEDSQDPDASADVDPSEAAVQKEGTLLKMLSAKQVANYVSENSDDVDDPTQVLLDAIRRAPGMSEDDFGDLHDDVVQSIGTLLGSHPGKPGPVMMKVNKLLVRVHHMSPEAFNTQQSSLEGEARQLFENVDPIMCLRHWMESELADLLSNPQLGQALTDLGVK